jgi:hypothetical protein
MGAKIKKPALWVMRFWRTLSENIRTLFAYRRIIRALQDENVQLRESVQARAIAHNPTEQASEPKAEEPLKPIRFKRQSYAESQMQWEWEHNHKAQELVARAKDGFF